MNQLEFNSVELFLYRFVNDLVNEAWSVWMISFAPDRIEHLYKRFEFHIDQQ